MTEQPLIQESGEGKESWKNPRINSARVLVTFWSFFLMGSNDSLYGAILPYLETYYGISYMKVSLLFLSPVAGFIISTISNHSIHMRWGQRGVVLITGTCHIVAYTAASLHPPFPVLVVVYILVGLGSGTKQAAWNAFVGGLQNPNELLGLLHGLYGTGATLTPAIATILITRRGWAWYEFYYILIGIAAVDFVVSLAVFGNQTGRTYREKTHLQQQQDNIPSSDIPTVTTTTESRGIKCLLAQSRTLACFRHRIVILSSLYLLAYVGSEVALGGWIVTFMRNVRHGNAYNSGIVASGFWGGITVGRIILGFVTGRLFKNEKWAVTCYLAGSIAMQLLFWLVPNFVVSAICVAFLGFFLGPVFPSVIMCLSRLLPPHMRVSAVGICSAVGASGASIIPFLVGSIAQAKGVAVLQPIILAMLVLCSVIWFFIPAPVEEQEEEV